MSTMDTTLHLSATQMFIDQNPVTITPTRTARVSDGAGGYTDGAETILDPIICRRVGQRDKGSVVERTTADGQIVIPNGVFIFLPDANIRRGDKFEYEGKPVEVLFISKLPPWRIQAETYHYG